MILSGTGFLRILSDFCNALVYFKKLKFFETLQNRKKTAKPTFPNMPTNFSSDTGVVKFFSDFYIGAKF